MSDTRYVYTFWADGGECLYVGHTSNLPARLGRHMSERPWFPQVARIEVTVVEGADAGAAVEAATIRELNPTHNRVYTTHAVQRKSPCARCRRSRHAECSRVNAHGEPCPCGVCEARRTA